LQTWPEGQSQDANKLVDERVTAGDTRTEMGRGGDMGVGKKTTAVEGHWTILGS